MMRKVLAVAVALTLAGCASRRGVEVTLMMWGSHKEYSLMQKKIEIFEKKNPDIRVKILHYPKDYNKKLQAMFTAGTPPDVMYIDSHYFPDYVTKGVLLDLTPFIKGEDGLNLDKYYKRVLDVFTWDGKYYGIAKDFSVLMAYYNVDLFEKYGIEPPSDNWTWNDFLKIAKKLTVDEDGDGRTDTYGTVVETWVGWWYPWLLQNGGQIYENGEWVIGSPKYLMRNVEALNFIRDLVVRYKVAPSIIAYHESPPEDLFMAGKVGICFYGRWKSLVFADIKKFRWNLLPMPRRRKKATTLFTVAYCISKKTRKPKEAWKLLKFLVGEESEIITAESGHAIPVLVPIAKSEHFLRAPALPANVRHEVNLMQVECSYPLPVVPMWSRIHDIMEREMEEFLLQQEDAIKMIRDIEAEIQKLKA